MEIMNVKRRDTGTRSSKCLLDFIDDETLRREFEDSQIIPYKFEQNELLTREIAFAAVINVTSSQGRIIIHDELADLKELKAGAYSRIEKSKKLIAQIGQIEDVETLRDNVPYNFHLFVRDQTQKYKILLQEEFKFMKLIDSKIEQLYEWRDSDKFFGVTKPQQFILYLNFLYRKFFPRSKGKKYKVPSRLDWILNILDYYGYEINYYNLKKIICRAGKVIPNPQDNLNVFRHYFD